MEPLHSITHAHGLKALFYVLFCHALSVDHIAQSSETCDQCAFKTCLLVFLVSGFLSVYHFELSKKTSCSVALDHLILAPRVNK